MPLRRTRDSGGAPDRALELITRPTSSPPAERGPLFPYVNNLLVTMRQNSDILSERTVGGEDILYTPEVTFRYVGTDGKKRDAAAAAHIIRMDSAMNVYLSLDPDTSNHEMATYQITNDGFIEQVDGGTWTDVGDPNVAQLVPFALEKINVLVTKQRDQLARNKQETAERRKELALKVGKRIAVGTIVLVTVGGVGSGVKWTWGKLVSEPHEQDRIERVAFDKKEVILPGEGVGVTIGTVEGIPKSQLEEIPKLKDGDKLDHARRVSVLEENTCIEVENEIPADSQVVIVAGERSPFENSTYSIARSGDTFEVCFTDVVDGDEGTSAKSDVAIQVKN